MIDMKLDEELQLVQEPVVEFWECISRDWPEHKYDLNIVSDLTRLLRQYGEDHELQIKRVLDCGCGTGNPGIGLAKQGFSVVGVDNDQQMINRFGQNCLEEKVSIPILNRDWADLEGAFQGSPLFDAVICRGNSLIYSGSWENMPFHPRVAKEAIEASLRSMASALEVGGALYVDLTSSREYSNPGNHYEFVGVRRAENNNVMIYWSTKHDVENRSRHVFGHRIFESKETRAPERITSHEFTGYLLYHEELIDLAQKAGLTYAGKSYRLPSEWLYDGFVFRKT